MSGLSTMRERYLAPLPSNVSVRDVAAEMLVLLKFFVIGGLIVLLTALNKSSSALDMAVLLLVAAGFMASWVWWTKTIDSKKHLAPAAVAFAVVSVAAFIVANNPMGLMLVWAATAVVYLSFTPRIAFAYCMVPVSLTFLVHVLGGSSITRIITETTVALLLVAVGFQVCVSAKDTSTASVERAQAFENLRHVNTELSAALQQSRDLTLEKERSRIAASLHDSLGHRLISVTMGLEYAIRMRTREADNAWAEVERSRENVMDALEEMRVVVRALHPIKLEGESLGGNLSALAASFRSTRLRVSTQIEDLPLDSGIGELVVAATQEALTNIVRHSQATQVDVTLESYQGDIELRIIDDGKGANEPFGFGLRSLEERVVQAGGLLRVEPHGGLGQGFALIVLLPGKAMNEYANSAHR